MQTAVVSLVDRIEGDEHKLQEEKKANEAQQRELRAKHQHRPGELLEKGWAIQRQLKKAHALKQHRDKLSSMVQQHAQNLLKQPMPVFTQKDGTPVEIRMEPGVQDELLSQIVPLVQEADVDGLTPMDVMQNVLQNVAINAMKQVLFHQIEIWIDIALWWTGVSVVLMALWMVLPTWKEWLFAGDVQRPKGAHLGFVPGLAAVLTAWILTGHFIADNGVGNSVFHPGHQPVAVQILIVLAGFMLHHVYGNQQRFYDFYVARLGGFVLCYYAASLCELALQYHTLDEEQLKYEVPFMLTLTQSWFPGDHFSHQPAWIFSALFCGIVFFPYLQRWMRMDTWKLVLLLLVCHALPFWPMLVAAQVDFPIQHLVYSALYRSPIFRAPEFIGGMIIAELFAREIGGQGRVWAAISDISFVAILAFAALSHGLELASALGAAIVFAPQALIGLMLFGCAKQPGLAGHFLESSVLKLLGTCAVQVYLWQGPVAELFKVFESGWVHPDYADRRLGSHNLVLPYFVTLWTLAAVWAVYVDHPFRSYLQSKVGTPKA